MPLKDLFLKPVDRPIEGVIKADDEASLRLEVEEYVLTNEVAKRLESFLAEYNHPQNANGVWVSGFFGSGKSHLLKMLALTLGNRDLSGAEAVDLFLPKCGDNEILKAELKRAAKIPSESVLFNIDQKADVISKGEFDAVLAVFMKVFDEMRGYYGRQGHIARFERDLDGKGKLAAFKTAFEDAAGIPWESGRETAALEAGAIAAAYASVTGTAQAAGLGILDKYRADYRVSIEDFAGEVKDYIDERGKDFRLNFFVDEVGQYIGDNVKLMTNLQTIAESLATKCDGRAWIIVTAQEDMSTVMGETGAFQSDDFSKIQARFAIRLKLTSADVAEVIRKRLLQKNEAGIAILSDLYQDKKNNFKTLFDFADGSQSYRNFRDGEEFIHSYPFIPYQYALFQASIQNLSQHNAFEGRHTAVGERSMLGVFQDVAKEISGHEVGRLATFDLMFEGIRTALKAQVQRSILTAEKHLDDTFAIQVLKALFLVKYVREFKATIRNLTILLLDHFDADLPELKDRIESALNLLESQTYIQRNGDLYEYLTDEEKDVEDDIKLTSVDAADVSKELSDMIFDGVLRTNKIRYESNKQDFPFERKLDEKSLSRPHELAIHVISPFHEHAGSEGIIRAHSMGRDELLVIMPLSERLIRDLRLYKQTDRYVRQNTTITESDTVRRILADKQVQNQSRKNALKKLVSELVSQSTLVVGGQDLDLGFSAPEGRLKAAFQALVTRTYPNLQMLRGKLYSETEITQYLNPSSTLFEGDDGTVSEAEQEVLGYIKLNSGQGLRTTLQSLVSDFEKKPYGWHNAAILCMLSKLCARGKVELRRDSVMLEGDALERALKNSYDFGKVIITPQVDFPQSQVRQLKEFYADFFDGPAVGTDARSVGLETGKALGALKAKVEDLTQQAFSYPFVEAVKGRVAELDEYLSKPYGYYLTELGSFEHKLSDLKEDVLDPFTTFMGGQQRKIYDAAHALLRDQAANLGHIEGTERESITVILGEMDSYRGKRFVELSTLTTSLKAKLEEAVADCRAWAASEIDTLESRVSEVAEFGALNDGQKAEIASLFGHARGRFKRAELIAVIRQDVVTFREVQYPEILQKVSEWAKPPTPPPGPEPDGPAPPAPPPVKYIPRSQVEVKYSKAALASEEDVEEYLSALRSALLAEIESGKRISV